MAAAIISTITFPQIFEMTPTTNHEGHSSKLSSATVVQSEIDRDIIIQRLRDTVDQWWPELDADPSTIILEASTKSGVDNLLVFVKVQAPEAAKRIEIVAKYLKPQITAPDAPQREFQSMQALSLLDRSLYGVQVPKPLVLFDDIRTVVMTKAAGSPLNDYIRHHNRWTDRADADTLQNLMKRCATFLAKAHQVRLLNDNSEITAESTGVCWLLDGSRDVGSALIGYELLPPDVISRVQLFIERQINHCQNISAPETIQHGDYYGANILYDGQVLTCIDFAFAKPGLPYHDVARFMGMLSLIKPDKSNLNYNFLRITYLRQTFLNAYLDAFPLAAPAAHRLVPAYEALVILRHALRHLRNQSWLRRQLYQIWYRYLISRLCATCGDG